MAAVYLLENGRSNLFNYQTMILLLFKHVDNFINFIITQIRISIITSFNYCRQYFNALLIPTTKYETIKVEYEHRY